MSKLKIAIAGLGFGEKVHIPAIKESNYFNLKYLYHHNKNKIDEIETKKFKDTSINGVPNLNAKWTSSNKDELIDIVINKSCEESELFNE